MAYFLHVVAAITAVIAWAVVWFASNKKLQKSLHFKGLLAAAITLVVMEGCFHCLNEYWEDSEEVLRDVNEAELANTTRLQEALIMQAYLCRDDPEAIIQHIEWDRPHPKQDSDDAETMAAEGKVELFDYLDAHPLAVMQLGPAMDDLVSRGLLQKGKIADMEAVHEDLSPGAKLISNIMLTQKGKELARDIEYTIL